MPIFEIKKEKLVPIKEQTIKLEKNIQKLSEDNINMIFGLSFVSTEFQLQRFRIDTLAFDDETKSFVIIEYKRDRSFSVVDQGYSYLALMLNNKADFILEYNEKKESNLKKKDVDWTQSRVIFVANSFTKYQRNAINFKDLPIELWEVKKFNNNTILFNQLKSTDSRESIKTITKNKTIENVSKEIKKYSIDDHFNKGWENSKDLFDLVREKIINIDSRIEEKTNKYYIGYKIGAYNLCTIHIYKSKLTISLIRVEKENLNDPENKIVTVPWKERGWGKECQYIIEDLNDIDYALFLIKQVYEKYYS
jgi:predicted transport protein